jgi:PD-(D/E)XK nuclease superfamily
MPLRTKSAMSVRQQGRPSMLKRATPCPHDQPDPQCRVPIAGRASIPSVFPVILRASSVRIKNCNGSHDRAVCRDPAARTEQIIGLAIKVHRDTGPGLLEATYEQCLCVELRRAGVHARTAAVCDRAVCVLPGIGQWRQHDRVKRSEPFGGSRRAILRYRVE